MGWIAIHNAGYPSLESVSGGLVSSFSLPQPLPPRVVMNLHQSPQGGMPDVPPPLPGERIPFLDALRGFALLGVFLVNIQSMGWPGIDRYVMPEELGFFGALGRALSLFFFDGAFWFLFAMLFGVGFAILTEAPEGRQAKLGTGGFLRRLLMLGVMGLVHSLFLWWGDVLLIYALCGLVLIFFRGRQDWTLLGWAIGVVALLISGVAMTLGAALIARVLPGEIGDALADEFEAVFDFFPDRDVLIESYRSGAFADVMGANLAELRVVWAGGGLDVIGMSLAAMLFGVWLLRKGMLGVGAEADAKYRRALPWALVLAVGGKLVFVLGACTTGEVDALWMSVSGVGILIGAPALGFLYLFFFRRWFQRHGEGWLSGALSATGRMTLTNYLMQSVIAVFLFRGFGLGLYAKISPPLLTLIAVVVFAGQVVFSRWWLSRFKLGPAERLLRAFTYLRKV